MAGGPARLWRNPAFLLLWLGQTVSLFGSQVTAVALPLTATLALGAGAAELGVLGALQTAPFLVVGLAAGVLVDRARRRPLLVAVDLGRALLLGSIPLAWALGGLGLGQLYAVGLFAGALRIVFSVAYSAYLPTVVARAQLVEGNSKLGVSAATAEVAGPGLGGALVALVTAPVAIAVDAASYLVSALSLALIREPEAPPGRPAGRPRLWAEAREGLAVVWRQPALRALAGYSALMNFFFQAIHAIFVLFVTGTLGLSPALFGAILTGSSAGGVLGALLVPGLTRRFGPGPALLVAAGCYGAGALTIPLAAGGPWRAAGTLLAAWGLIGVGNGLSNIVGVSLRQLLTPDHLLGRVSASGMAVGWSAAPLGALLGGMLGQSVGLRAALLLAALGTLTGVLWLACSPVRTLREPPPPVDRQAP